MQDRPNPYDREIETCEHIVAYLNRKKIQMGMIDEKDQDTKDVEKKIISQDNQIAV